MDNPASPSELVKERFGLPESPPGVPANPPPANGHMPPGDAQWAVMPWTTFQGVQNVGTRSYRWMFDEALKNSWSNALVMRNDLAIEACFSERKRGVVRMDWRIEPEDESDPSQAEAAIGIEKSIRKIRGLENYLDCLQEATWFGKYGQQHLLRFDYKNGRKQVKVAEWSPIDGDKIVHKFSGEPGLLFNLGYATDQRENWYETTERGAAHFLTLREREDLFVIHQWQRIDASYYDSQGAERLFGLGLRSRLYWWWWMKTNVFGYLMNFLDRFGAGGVTTMFYTLGDNASLAAVRAAAQQQLQNNVIFFPRRPDKAGAEDIEFHPISTAGADFIVRLLEDYFDGWIRQYIIGQNLTTGSGSTGLGSGVAEAHEDTFSRIISYDATMLEDTLTHSLVEMLNRYNYPGNPCPSWRFAIDTPDVGEFMEAAKFYFEMGGRLSAQDTRDKLGLSEPDGDDDVLSMMGPQQPAAVGNPPVGVPVQTPGGPQQQQGVPPDQDAGAIAAQVQAQGNPAGVAPQQMRRVIRAARQLKWRHASRRGLA